MEDDDDYKSTENLDEIRVDVARYYQGMNKPLATHRVLDADLFAANQTKQTKFTETALLTAGTCVYSHGDQSVEIVHKGDTRPLLFARSRPPSRPAAAPHKRVLAAEAKKRSADAFMHAKSFGPALATYDEALNVLGSHDDVPGGEALSATIRLSCSEAALKTGDFDRAEAEADKAAPLHPDAARLRRALARVSERRSVLL